ncbi:MAG: DUF502 domain-containing protein [Cetobacterium sp.]|uniref:DUF502 domain-containing protein n=1 Tax=Cetobacterium TaxID=180162 RepID=UPI001F06A35A|nr:MULTISPECIES: DUF502 domain-containing protein [Cetobacterium]MCX3067855.1 DUF502 domain-containing protein [Cetobacterium somerae]UPO97849.1 DUF502 domain-containing protein [Cetobacterium somerae]
MKRVKASFYSGLIAILPIVITVYIFNWIFQIFLNLLQDSFLTVAVRSIVLQTGLGKEQDLHLYTQILINVLSFVTLILLLIAIGTAMRVFLFKKIGAFLNNLLVKIPLFSQIYSTITQIISLFASDRQKSYQKVVMFEYPRQGIYSIGFMTSDSNHFVEEVTGEAMCNVFLPTSPNPTSGMFIVLKKSEVRVLDLKVDDAIKLIISGGVILPPNNKKEN